MPKINKIRIIHFGVKMRDIHQVYYPDLMLDLRGESTYVHADNGTGKSTLIGLLLYSLRPIASDFPRGEGGAQNYIRKFSDYIFTDRPGIVMIEWILNPKEPDSTKTEYLTTGLMAIKENELKEVMFHREYQGNDNSWIDIIEFKNAKSNAKSFNEMKSWLRKNNFVLTTRKHQWIEILDNYLIHSTLIYNLLQMNQTENSMKAGMSYENEIDFVVRTFKQIIPEPQNSDRYGLQLKSQFKTNKEIPLIEIEIRYLDRIVKQLEEFKELPGIKQMNEHGLIKLNQEYQILSKDLTIFANKLNEEAVSLKKDIHDLEENFEKTHTSKATKEKELYLAEYKYKHKRILELESQVESNKESKDQIQKELLFLGLHDSFKNITELEYDISILDIDLDKDFGQIVSDIAIYKDDLKEKIEQYYLQKSNEFSTLKNDHEKLQKLLVKFRTEYNTEKANLLNNEKMKTEAMQNLTNHEQKVSDFKKETGIDIELNKIFDYIKFNFENEESNYKILDDKNQTLLDNKSKLEKKVQDIKIEKKTIEIQLKSLENKLIEFQNLWNILLTNNLFISRFTNEFDEIRFELITSEYIGEVEETQSSLQSTKTIINERIKELKNNIDYYKKHGTFRYNPSLEEIVNKLKAQNLPVYTGWEYLDANPKYQDKALKYPFLFESVLVPESKFEDLKNTVSEHGDFMEYDFVLMFVSLDFLKIKNESLDKLDTYIYPVQNTFNWRIEGYHKERKYEQLIELHHDLDEKSKSLKDQIIEYQEYRDLLIQVNISNYENTKDEIKHKYSELDQVHRDIHVKNLKISSISQKQNDFKKEMNEITKILDKWKDCRQEYLKIDYLKDEIPKTKSLIKKLVVQITAMGELIEKLNIDIQMSNDQITRNTSSLDVLNNEINQLEELYKDYIEKMINLKQIVATDDLIEEPTIENINIVRKSLEMKLRTLEDNEDYQGRQKKLDIRKKRLNRDLREFVGELNKNQLNLNETREYYSNRPTLLSNTTERIKLNQKLNTDSSKLELNIEKNKSEIEQDQKSMIEIRKLNPSFHNLDTDVRPIEELHNSFLILKNAIEKMNIDINQLNEEIIIMKQKYDQIVQDQKYVGSMDEIISATYTNIIGRQRNYNFQKNITLSTSSINVAGLINSDIIIILGETKDSLLKKKDEIFKNLDTYDELNLQFENRRNLLLQNFTNKNIIEQGYYNYFENLQIDDIMPFQDEMKNRVDVLAKKLESHKNQMANIPFILSDQLTYIFENIIRFQNESIPIGIDENSVIKKIRPIEINFTFTNKMLDGQINASINEFLTELSQRPSYPEEWISYVPLFTHLVKSFVKNRIKSIKLIRSETGGEYAKLPFGTAMKGSGGENATLAIVLFCLISHYKTILKVEHAQLGSVQKTKDSSSIPFINDNPIGQANKTELLRLQLNLAKELDIQLIYFSGIQEEEKLEEFPNNLFLHKSDQNHVVDGNTKELIKNIVETGPQLFHDPIRYDEQFKKLQQERKKLKNRLKETISNEKRKQDQLDNWYDLSEDNT